MASWSFLTSHALVQLRTARDPGVRLRDIAASVGITERSGIVTGLAESGYGVKQKDGRNRYQIQAHLPLPGPVSQELATGEVLALLNGAAAPYQRGRAAKTSSAGATSATPATPAAFKPHLLAAATRHGRVRC